MIDKDYRYSDFRYAKSVEAFKQIKGGFRLYLSDGRKGTLNADITIAADNIVKIHVARGETTKLEPDFINHSFLPDEADVKIDDIGDSLCISGACCSVVMGKNPFSLTVYGDKRKVVYIENIDDVNPVGGGEDRIMPLGYTLKADGGIAGMNFCGRLRHDEHIYGLGERFTEFDKRGQRITMWNYDTLGCRDEKAYKNIPFYISSYGYGLFLNSHQPAEFNVGSESTASINVHCPGDEMEYYIITGSLKDIVSTYTNLTGPAVLPPDWSFGLWFSTGFAGTNSEMVEEDARKLRELDIPCDVIHFDCYWLRDNMWCDFVWDDAMYPDRLQMIGRIKDMGYKICLWINPYVTIKTDMYLEGEKSGYFAKNTDGRPYLADLWHGLLPLCAIVDMTNPEAAGWFRGKLKSVLSEGVDVLKTDFGEDIPAGCIFYNGKSGEEMRNVYSILYNEVVFKEIKKVKGEENGLVWARSGFAGMQKYPVCWSGDPRSSFEGMAGVLKSGLSLGLSGVPFWSHDIGGFYGKVDDEVYVRWAQFGLFSSHSRMHGTTSRQPWAFSDRACKIAIDFIRLRYRLMPYILKTARSCCERGLPFIRPLVLEHANDPGVFNICDQYYFGDDIMVAPVFGGHNQMRNVYLPEGEWSDLLTGQRYFGRRWLSVKCELEYMPIFVKNNANIGLLDKPDMFIPQYQSRR